MRLPGMQRIKTELRDLIELVLVPGIAALLPWRWSFAFFKRMAHVQWLYRGACLQALAAAKALGAVEEGDEARWLATRRLVTLVDHADHYLAITRSDQYMARHVAVQGQWPAPDQPGICVTFHWGAGMWALRHASAHGLQAHALVAAMEGTPFAGRWVLRRYAVARTHSVGQALGRDPLVVSGSLRPVLQALRRNQQVFAAVDVPSDQVDASVEVTLLGRKARVPKALFRLACDMRIPVTVYTTGFDADTGVRSLHIARIAPPEASADIQALAQTVFTQLESSIGAEPAFWHFWGEAPRFFSR